MGLKDRHDKRLFTHFGKVNTDGTVAAIVEVADGAPLPRDADESAYVDVTEYRRSQRTLDLYAVKVDAQTLADDAKVADADRPTLAAQFKKALALAATSIKTAEVVIDGDR